MRKKFLFILSAFMLSTSIYAAREIIPLSAKNDMSGGGRIRVCEGGTLIVDGGTLQNADLTLIPGSTLILRNNGKIYMDTVMDFEAPEGVVVNIESGEIN